MALYIEAKTILSKLKNPPDSWLGITYNMNLYRGCQHQCIYCDSRSSCYQLGDLADIRIKENALLLLEKELKSKRSRETIGFGSMNDPYMPIEKETLMVRKALHLLIRYNYPVHILTKSDLILRDTDLLQKLSKKYAAASFTITTISDKQSKIIEPAAPVSSLRLNAMRELAKANIYTGVLLMPILPFINDRWDEIEALIVASNKAGAKYLLFWAGLTLRAGSREYFYRKLDQHFPGIKKKYVDTYGEQYTCNSPNVNILHKKVEQLCRQLRLPMRINFYKENMPNQLNLFQ